MIKGELREKYRNLSRQELLEKAYELGFNFEMNSTSCSQCTAAALHEILDFEGSIVRALTSSCGGQCDQVVGTCGSLIGGTVVLDYYFGRSVEYLSHTERLQENIDRALESSAIAQLLYRKYVNEYGSIICPYIQARIFGRHYYFGDPDDEQKFIRAGGPFDPDKCSHVVGNAARWVMEILLDKGIIQERPNC